MGQPRHADGAADDPTGEEACGREHAAAGGPRPRESARRVAVVPGTGARGRGRLPTSPVRVAQTLRLLVDVWGWPVVPGAFVEGGTCSCGEPACAAPGRHALRDGSWLAATSDPERVRDRWRTRPEAAVVLPVGWVFDLLDVPERGGREAIGRLEAAGSPIPPVIASAGGRLLFLVAPSDGTLGEAAAGTIPASRAAVPTRSAVPALRTYDDEVSRDAAVAHVEPWPASSTWLASAAGCRPEPSVRGDGGPDAADVVVLRSGLLVAPLLGPEPPGITRWLVPPAPARRGLPRMQDVLGPIVQACQETASRPSGGSAGRSQEVSRPPDGAPRRSGTDSDRGAETVPVRGSDGHPGNRAGRADPGSEAFQDREAGTPPTRGPETGHQTAGGPSRGGGPEPAAGGSHPATGPDGAAARGSFSSGAAPVNGVRWRGLVRVTGWVTRRASAMSRVSGWVTRRALAVSGGLVRVSGWVTWPAVVMSGAGAPVSRLRWSVEPGARHVRP